jgi:ATP-dependent DNA helicase RecQ
MGKTGLMRALRGTPDAPIKPDRTSAFGALAALKKADVDRLIESLIECGYLRRDEDDEYRRLYLTTEGREAVTLGEADIEWRLATPPPPAPAATVQSSSKKGDPGAASESPADTDPELYESLRTWRRGLAERDNVPPYVIFADKVLAQLAARKPRNEFDLLDIPGIGPAKAAKYGQAVFDLIEAEAANKSGSDSEQ